MRKAAFSLTCPGVQTEGLSQVISPTHIHFDIDGTGEIGPMCLPNCSIVYPIDMKDVPVDSGAQIGIGQGWEESGVRRQSICRKSGRVFTHHCHIKKREGVMAGVLDGKKKGIQ